MIEEIRFKDIDADTGNIIKDKKLCSCEKEYTKWIINVMQSAEMSNGNANREFYSVKI